MRRVKRLFKKQFVWIFSLLILISNSWAWANKVSQVKGKRALLELDQTTVSPGEEFFTVDAAGKKKGIIKIKQVKGKKAIADIVRGKPEAGHSLTPRIAPTKSGTASPGKRTRKSTESSASSTETMTPTSSTASGWGVLGNVYMNSMTAKIIVSGPREVTVSMKGTSFGVGGLYDYRMSSNFAIRGIGGFDQYQLSGSTPLNDCSNSMTCTVSINYLSGYGIARYDFTTGPTKFWAGGGLGFLFALSKSSTILDTTQISTNLVYMGSFGADIKMSGNSFLPLQFDYAFFQGSDSVKANSMIFRAGWGFYF